MGNTTHLLSSRCIYPCFDSIWPLRDKTEIQVVEGSYGEDFETNRALRLLFTVYVLFISSAISNVTIAILTIWKGLRTRLGISSSQKSHISSQRVSSPRLDWLLKPLQQEIIPLFHRIGETWKDLNMTVFQRFRGICLVVYVLSVHIYAILISPFALFFFLIYMEFYIWNADFGGESFRHVGKWGSVAVVVLVIIAAAISKFFESLDNLTGGIELEGIDGPNYQD